MASDSKATSTKPRHVRRSPSPHRRHRREDHDVRELLEKLQTFEDELQRRKEKQNEEILRSDIAVENLKGMMHVYLIYFFNINITVGCI